MDLKDWLTVGLGALTVVLTVAIVVLSYCVWKTYKRIEWLTGSMETHSSLMLQIEAMRGINEKPIDLVWWDPTIEAPPVDMGHRKAIDLKRIHVFLPPELRQHKKKVPKRLAPEDD